MTSSDEKQPPKPATFTIEHILNVAGEKKAKTTDNNATMSWLRCTRYCPPKIPRNQKREGSQRRQLGKHPRIPFSNYQLAVLEEKFRQSSYLSREEVTQLARSLNLADIRVKIWFQNRRARERREREIVEAMQIEKESISSNEEVKTELIPETTSASNYLLHLPQSPIDYRPISIFQNINCNK